MSTNGSRGGEEKGGGGGGEKRDTRDWGDKGRIL